MPDSVNPQDSTLASTPVSGPSAAASSVSFSAAPPQHVLADAQLTAADSAVAATLATALPSEPPVAAGGVGSRRKEAAVARGTEAATAGELTPELPGGPGRPAEAEPQHEREMNLERLESQIQEAKARGPKKVAVAAQTMPTQEPKTVAQPVVILPLSEKNMQEAGKKSPQFSVKWLWVWCRRQMKKFAEIIVMYRDPQAGP